MKRTSIPSFPALLAAALLPGVALVGCKSTDTANTDTAPATGDAAVSEVEIVRPAAPADKKDDGAGVAAVEAAEVAAPDEGEAKAKKKFRLFGKKRPVADEGATPAEVAEAAADGGGTAEAEPVAAEATPRRKPLFGSKKDKAAGGEVAEKKKRGFLGFGRKKEKDPEPGEVPADETLVADSGQMAKPAEKEAAPIDLGAEPLPWDEAQADFPGDETDSDVFASHRAPGVTARIRPGDLSGGIVPAPIPAPDDDLLDSVPSLTADPPVTRPRDDGFVPLSPEPKFPGAEQILPPGN